LTTTKISSKLKKVFKDNKSFLIVGHINPEGDSLGASLALALGLKKMGKKEITVLSHTPVPEVMNFLPSSKMVKHKLPRRKVDVVVLVDCNEIKRTGFESYNAEHIVVIDHHVIPHDAARSPFYKSLAASLIDPQAAAAGLLVYKVLVALGVYIDKDIATNLYTAILTDTGGFKYSNASSESLKVASALVEAGAKPWDISKEVYASAPFKAVKLLGLSLATLDRNNGIAWIVTTRSMLKKTDTSAEDCEDFVDYPRKIKEAEVAVFFREDKKNHYKISLRSRGKVNVQKIAKSFGGGGHVAAAGCKVDGTLKLVQSKVFRAIRKEIKETK
jgi:phosphoesterase RecJ-like protein